MSKGQEVGRAKTGEGKLGSLGKRETPGPLFHKIRILDIQPIPISNNSRITYRFSISAILSSRKIFHRHN
jgi:hypothetical protein